MNITQQVVMFTRKGSQGFISNFLFGEEDCVQRSIVCEACKVFEPIFEYQSPMHKARVFIIIIILY